MSDHELRQGSNKGRAMWFCTCSKFVGGPGPGWVWFIPQRKTHETTRQQAQRLFDDHVRDSNEPPEW